jgi:hypothetical protein
MPIFKKYITLQVLCPHGGYKIAFDGDLIYTEYMTDHEFWMAIRQALLMALDALERKLGISPTTAQIRKSFRS